MVVDAVAALSCEAIKADVSAFNSVDSGDGFTPKDEIGVSSEMKVLLNGSKLVGAKLTGKETEGDVNGGNAQVDKKIEKKKKKVVLGKGTAVVVQVLEHDIWKSNEFRVI
ncbi:hypothetical protein CRG98_024589 [Punica granatum]|uniref:Uncharacterized protein n=1 Tax=Punica granatum TaxID=22663 RepID=A0A2I0JFG1_PUNGR|nr:hypothetical protein CRG98_024589 [Punica granatum]